MKGYFARGTSRLRHDEHGFRLVFFDGGSGRRLLGRETPKERERQSSKLFHAECEYNFAVAPALSGSPGITASLRTDSARGRSRYYSRKNPCAIHQLRLRIGRDVGIKQ